jgi:hypothetical protein
LKIKTCLKKLAIFERFSSKWCPNPPQTIDSLGLDTRPAASKKRLKEIEGISNVCTRYLGTKYFQVGYHTFQWKRGVT